MQPDAQLNRIATAQGNFISRRQGLAAGVPDSSFTKAMRRLGWAPSAWGQWTPEHWAGDFAARCARAVERVGAPVIVTGAASLHLQAVMTSAPEVVELVQPRTRRTTPIDGICRHSVTHFSRIPMVIRDGLHLAAAPWSLLHHARHAGIDDLIWLLASLLRLRLSTLGRVRSVLQRAGNAPGSARLRTAVGLLGGEISHSGEERYARRLLRGVVPGYHPAPYTVRANGHKIGEVDIPWIAVRYGVEVDGPPHLLERQARRDRERDRSLRRDADWTIDRFLWLDIRAEPLRFVREVAEGLRAAERRAALRA
jgi:hypothetical protein